MAGSCKRYHYIKSKLSLLEDLSEESPEYKTRNGLDKADGVHLYFQKNNILIWDEVITALDYTLKIKTSSNT